MNQNDNKGKRNLLFAVFWSVCFILLLSGETMAQNTNREVNASLRLLSLNTHLLSPIFEGSYAKALDGGGPSQTYIDQAAYILERLLNDGNDYDVIALYEVWPESLKDTFVEKLHSKYPFYIKKMYGCSDWITDDQALFIALGGVASGGLLPGVGMFLYYKTHTCVLGKMQTPWEDSGLMLFSKYPFEDLPGQNRTIKSNMHVEGMESFENVHDTRIAFKEYDHYKGIDGAASKGVGVVRIRKKNSVNGVLGSNAYPEMHYNIIFTHDQADEIGGYASTRKQQFGEIKDVIMQTLGSNVFSNPKQEVFLVGDLNVYGDSCTRLDDGRWIRTPEHVSLMNYIRDPYPSLNLHLYDAWGKTSSPWDCGNTATTGMRYDYVLQKYYKDSSSPPVDLDVNCVQHLTKVYMESDHAGILADINKPIDHCNPNLAEIIYDVPTDSDTITEEGADATGASSNSIGLPMSGKLPYRGTMQWFRVDQAGTFTIALPNDYFGLRDDDSWDPGKLSLEVYSKYDLSTPRRFRSKKIITEKQDPRAPRTLVTYDIPEHPFYIRVRSEYRDWGFGGYLGDYNFVIHRRSCLVKADACILNQNEQPIPVPAFNPTKIQVGNQPFWFYGNMGVALTRQPQTMTFNARDWTQPYGMRLELFDQNENQLAAFPSDEGSFACQEQIYLPPCKESVLPFDPAFCFKGCNISIPYSGEGDHKFYLRLSRESKYQDNFELWWTTNLNYIAGVAAGGAPMEVYVKSETPSPGNIGSDEGYIAIETDNGYENAEYVTFDGKGSDSHIWLEDDAKKPFYNGRSAFGFINHLTVRAVETESGENQSASGTIFPIPPDAPDSQILHGINLHIDLNLNPSGKGGIYQFIYTITNRYLNGQFPPE